VLVPTIANSIFADTVQGLSDELEPLGYAVILAQSRYDAAREDHMLAALLSRRPEAIIMVARPRRMTAPGCCGVPAFPSFEDLGSSGRTDRRRRRILIITPPGSRWRGISFAQGRQNLASSVATIPRDAALERFQGYGAGRRRENSGAG